MRWMLFLLLGVGFGIVAALPMGPVGVLIFRYTLRRRRRWALLSILGQTAAIFSYVALVTVGLEGLLLDHPLAFHGLALVGAVLVSGLGLVTLRSARRGSAITAVQTDAEQPAHRDDPADRTSFRHVTTAFALAFTNPGNIILLLTAVAVHGSVLGGALRGVNLGLYLLSVLVGIEGWFLSVVIFLPRLIRRPKAQQRLLRYLEWIAGSLLMAFGLFLLLREGATLWRLA